LAAAALPWTPLRELTALPQTHRTKGRSKERRGKEMRGGEKE